MTQSHLTYIDDINGNKVNLPKKPGKSIAIAKSKSKK